jgi:hypothetical protein
MTENKTWKPDAEVKIVQLEHPLTKSFKPLPSSKPPVTLAETGGTAAQPAGTADKK